jgi:hypothetical protein
MTDQRTSSATNTGDPLARANELAEKMANVLEKEDVADVALALALLTSGVIDFYADGLIEARFLVDRIRQLEDELIQKSCATSHQVLQ